MVHTYLRSSVTLIKNNLFVKATFTDYICEATIFIREVLPHYFCRQLVTSAFYCHYILLLLSVNYTA